LIGFFKIKPRHPDGLNKTDLGGKKTEMGAVFRPNEYGKYD